MILGGLVLALLGWALLFGGGTDPGRLAWVGGAAIAAACACVALLPLPRLSRAAWAFLGLFAAYAGWVALSVLWSWAPDRAWDAFNRDLVYLAFAVLGVYLVRLGIDRLGTGLLALVGAVAAWALLTRVFPGLDDESERVNRLREPIGYWNVLAFVLVLGLPLALRLRREAAALTVYALTVPLLFTYSRGGLVAGAVAVGAYALLARPGLAETVAVLAAGAAPAAAVFATDADGWAFALLLAAGAGVAVALLRFVPARALALAGAAVGAVGLAAAAVALGNPLDEFRNDPTEQRPGTELLTTTSNNRWTWWNEAWDAWADHPAAGTGAGSFELVHRRLRESELHANDPHNLALDRLSETGLVGFLLFAGAAVAAVAAARVRTPAAAALAAGGIAYLVQSFVDMHWEYVAATAPVMVIAGALAADGAEVSPGRSRGRSLAAGVVLVALLYSVAAPAVSDSRVARAQARIAAEDYAGALDAADSARGLNPLAAEPLYALGLAEDLRGDRAAALAHYEDAVALQPENWRTWYELGVFEYLSLRELDAAFLDLDKAYSLDRRNVAVQRWLDRVRDELNAG